MQKYFDTLQQWLQAMPDTLIGVIIGSFFTLAGVVLTNRTNLRNLRLQLEHDRQQKAKERAMSMRRDVYLAAAEALSSALSTIVRYGDLSLNHSDLIEDYRQRSGQIAKIHVIATETTALRFVSFMRELSRVFVKLNIQRAQLLLIKTKMQSLLDQMRRHQTSRDQYLELMKQFNVDGTIDDRRFVVLDKGFQFEQDSASKAATEHDALLEQLRPRHLEFVDFCQHENARLSRLLLPLVESVRVDLEQPIDIHVYEEVLAGAPVATRSDLEALFGVIRHEEKA
jgi:hypothetical protein